MTLQQLAFVLFAAIALGGLLMGGLIVARIQLPRLLGPLHGVGGLTGLALLLAANLRHAPATPLAWWALTVFAAGFCGGLLFFVLLFPKRTPLPLVAAHGGLALVGLYLLYRASFPGA